MSKTVVITGANRGIGLALAQCFSNQGDKVIAVCRKSSDELEQVAGVEVIAGVDVIDEAGLELMAQKLESTSIDVLICNAGILRDENIETLNCQTIREQFEVNALAPLRVVSALLAQLAGGAKVAMITSRMGSIEDNTSGGRYGYRMSKAALNIASMSLAHDLADRDIAIGIFHPGYVQTDMVNHGGDISSTECAGRLTGLINDLSMADSGVFRHSNGQVLPW